MLGLRPLASGSPLGPGQGMMSAYSPGAGQVSPLSVSGGSGAMGREPEGTVEAVRKRQLRLLKNRYVHGARVIDRLDSVGLV